MDPTASVTRRMTRRMTRAMGADWTPSAEDDMTKENTVPSARRKSRKGKKKNLNDSNDSGFPEVELMPQAATVEVTEVMTNPCMAADEEPKPVTLELHSMTQAAEAETEVVPQPGGKSRIPRLLQPARSVSSVKKGKTPSHVRKTPNFSKIHERVFMQMESVDDYVKRKKVLVDTVSKTVIKKSVLSTQSTAQYTDSNCKKALDFTKKASKRNSPVVQRSAQVSKVDPVSKPVWKRVPKAADVPSFESTLNSALNEKFPYKPYTGKVEPLEVDQPKKCKHPVAHAADKFNVKMRRGISSKDIRNKKRDFLGSVRSNKRFDLMMKMRGVNSDD